MSTVVKHLIGSVTEANDDWRKTVVLGGSGKVIAGYAQTQAMPGPCSPGWFSGESTLILGVEAKPKELSTTVTQIEWHIPVPPSDMKGYDAGFMVIATKRVFGGLHSAVFGAKVDVFLNDITKEDFKLEVIPPQHSDYFHRPIIPDSLPRIAPLDRCGTIYAWPLDEHDLNLTSPNQIVRVRTGRNATWDVDYVAIVLNVRRRRLRGTVWRTAEVVAAAILGALATRFLG